MDPMNTALAILVGLILASTLILAQLGVFKLLQVCRGIFPFHVWSRWGQPYNGIQRRSTGHFGDTRDYQVMVQSRWCARCGAVDHRITDVDVRLADIAESALPRRVERQ